MFRRAISCLPLFICLLLVGVCAAAKRPHMHHVVFSNQLTNKVLNVNCKNMNPYIDLGLQILLPKEEYRLDYKVNRTMLYSCNLRHGDTNTVFKVSDPATKRECGANKCVWKAAEDGVYLLSRKTNQYTLKYQWGQKYSDMHFT